MSGITDRRTFTKTAIAGLTAAAFGIHAGSTLAMRPGPSSASDITPTMYFYLEHLFEAIAKGDTSLIADSALGSLPEKPVQAGIIAVPTVNVDLNDEVNVAVVYSGLRREGGIYYDFLHLRVENGEYIVTSWENRLPTAA